MKSCSPCRSAGRSDVDCYRVCTVARNAASLSRVDGPDLRAILLQRIFPVLVLVRVFALPDGIAHGDCGFHSGLGLAGLR